MSEARRNNGPKTGRDASGRFASGNAGRPRGARHKSTLAALALLEGEGERLTRKCIEMALQGDAGAMRLCLDRILPRGRAVRIDLPMKSLADLDAATDAIGAALAGGGLGLDEVATLAGLVEARRKVIETTELERRIAALEGKG